MSSDMTERLMEQQPYGKVALEKLNKHRQVPENFRLFHAQWLGDRPTEWETMKITGAEFCAAKSGKNKGKLSIKIKGTDRTVYVTVEEMEKFKEPSK